MLRRKYADYGRYGVDRYWIINPDDTEPVLEENERVGEAYQVRSETIGDAWFAPAIFPGLQLCLSALVRGDRKAAVKVKGKRLF